MAMMEEITWRAGYMDGLKGFPHIVIIHGKGKSRNPIAVKLDSLWPGNQN